MNNNPILKKIIIIILAILGIVVTYQLPNWLACRKCGNMSTAQNALITLYNAEKVYKEISGKGNFTTELSKLSGERGDEILIGTDIANMQTKPYSGYLLGPIKVIPKTDTTPSTFSVIAYPIVKDGFKRTGDDCYYIDQTGILRHSSSTSINPDANSSPLK